MRHFLYFFGWWTHTDLCCHQSRPRRTGVRWVQPPLVSTGGPACCSHSSSGPSWDRNSPPSARVGNRWSRRPRTRSRSRTPHLMRPHGGHTRTCTHITQKGWRPQFQLNSVAVSAPWQITDVDVRQQKTVSFKYQLMRITQKHGANIYLMCHLPSFKNKNHNWSLPQNHFSNFISLNGHAIDVH